MCRSLFGNGRAALASYRSPGEIPDEGGRGLGCVTPGLPSHDCILLAKPRNRRYRLRHIGWRSSTSCVNKVMWLNLAQGSSQLAGSLQAIARVTERTSPGAPLKNWGEEQPRPARVDTPGPKTMPKYRINFDFDFVY